MRDKKARRSLKGFFSSVGSGVFKVGESVQKIPAPLKRSKPQPEKPYEVPEELQETQRPAVTSEEYLTEEEKLDEEWEKKDIRVKRASYERLSRVFFRLFERPAQRLANFFKGMEHDLYSADLKISPERYIAMMMGISLVTTVLTVSVMIILNVFFLFVILGSSLAFIFSMFFMRTQPKRRARARVVEVNRSLPYALRHMGTQLSSGIGLPETITSVSRADYGILSDEFGKIIRDANAGMSFEEALTAMDNRIESEPLRRATRQIQRTLRTGGDLAKTLSILADETAFELRMKLRDYTQSLNMLTMIYMFVSAVIPAMLMVTISISSSGGRGGISPQAAGVIYLILLPFLLFYFVVMIKRFEPRL